MQDEGYSVQEVARLIRRRFKVIGITFLSTLLLSVVLAYSFESLYRSSGTIIIDAPEVAGQFLPGTYQAPDREQRIVRIYDEVMTTENLAEIVEKHKLYPDMRGERSARAVVSELRDNFELELLLAKDDPRNKTVGEVTGFQLAYYHPDPVTSRDVTRNIVELFLEGNRTRRQQAYADTAASLAREVENLRIKVARVEAQLADFKSDNPGALPEDRAYNRGIVERKARDLDSLDREIRSLQERKTSLQSQLAQTDLWITALGPDGEPLPASNDRLTELQTEYLRLIGIYNASHPDVIRVRREIDALTGGIANPAFRQAMEAELTAREIALFDAEQQYGANHPDVLNLRRSMAALQEQILKLPAKSLELPPPNNPIYVNLQLQLQGVNTELAALRQDRRQLKTETEELDIKVQIAPEVERRYLELTRDLGIARQQYEDTMSRQMAVVRAGVLEEEELSERYVVTKIPVVSYTPAFPNRPLFIVVGIFLGVTFGLGIGILAEIFDESIRNTRDIKSILSVSPIAAIPTIQTDDEIRQILRSRLLSTAGVAVAIVAVMIYVQLQRSGAV